MLALAAALSIEVKAFLRWQIFDPNYANDVNYATIDTNLTTTIVMDTNMRVDAIWKCGSAALIMPMVLGAMGIFGGLRRRADQRFDPSLE